MELLDRKLKDYQEDKEVAYSTYKKSAKTSARVGKLIHRVRKLRETQDKLREPQENCKGKWSLLELGRTLGHGTGNVITTLEKNPEQVSQTPRFFDTLALLEICGIPFGIITQLNSLTDKEFKDYLSNLSLHKLEIPNPIPMEDLQKMDIPTLNRIKVVVDNRLNEENKQNKKRKEIESQIACLKLELDNLRK